MEMKRIFFVIYLGVCAWQDLRQKSVSVWIFLLFGAGAIVCGPSLALETVLSVGLGLFMLGLSAIIRNSIGAGDGLFFTVSGLYLTFRENVSLLCNGLLFCGIFCLGFWVKGQIQGHSMGKETVPFLAFLIPAWICMTFL